MLSFTKLFLASILLTLVACAKDSNPNTGDDGGGEVEQFDESGPTVSVMTYNVENLFDTLKDKDRDDYTNLPKALKDKDPAIRAGCQKMTTDYYRQECLNLDWSDEVLDEKLNRLADTILSVNGVGPDVLILQEVENMNALQMLQKKLGKKIYKTAVLVEGDDVRGIDVGVLSKFPLKKSSKVRLHRIPFYKDEKNPNWKMPKTRGILEVPLKLPNGDKLVVLGFHFPSQSNPSSYRVDAVNKLNEILADKGAKEMVIGAGDSNITPYENETLGLQTRVLAEKWGVSHLILCKDRPAECKGTQVYRSEWSFLDVLLFNGNLGDLGRGSYRLKTKSIKVINTGKYQVHADTGFPARFDINKPIGVADHLPVYAELVLRKKK